MNRYFFGVASASVMSAMLVTMCSVFASEKTVKCVKFASAAVICLIFFSPLLELPENIGNYLDNFSSALESDDNSSKQLKDYGIDNLEKAVEKMVCGKFGLNSNEIEITVFTEPTDSGDVKVIFAEVVLYSDARLKNSGGIANYVAEILSCGVRIRGD